MRHQLWILLLSIFPLPNAGWAMCPFCPPAAPTLSEQVAESDAVALVSLVQSTPAKTDGSTQAISTWKVVSLLKNFSKSLKENSELKVPEHVAGQAGDLFLLMGKTEGRESAVLIWEAPKPISEIGFHYLKQAPAPESPRKQRLEYFVKFLEYPDPLLANDAYYEFAGADYQDLVLIKNSFSREKIRKWIDDPKTLASRLGLYGLMLGLCGEASDVELLKEKIRDDADKTRLGIDGIIGGYLLLTGEEGMDLLEETKVKNPKAPIADVHATMAALRFLWDFGEGVVPKARLKSAVRQLLDRPGAADLAIADLARWKDWSVQDRLMELYKKGDPSNPLGQISTRQAVIRYMIASTLDHPKVDDPTAPTPLHVIEGRKHIETLRKLDPKAVARSERFMLPQK